jgi:hypothetical protein
MDDEQMLPETAAGEVADEGKTVADCAARFPAQLVDDAPRIPVDAVIDQWFIDCIHNSPVSRQTEIFNHCAAAKEELKRRIAAL